jgi:hypothetical protein
MDRVSVIARDADRQTDIAGVDVRDRGNLSDEGAKIGAASGGALGGLTGLLVGLGALAIPGVGPIMLAGATATALATTLAGGAIGAVTGGLLGALIGLGIPEDRARVYNDRVSRGDYLVMVEGTDAEIARAEAILHRRGIEDYGVYDIPGQPAAATPLTPASQYGSPRQAVGFFPRRIDAEAAIADLRTAGFPMRQISLVAQNFDRRDAFSDLGTYDRLDNNLFGFPSNRFDGIRNHFDRGDYLVIVRGTDAEVRQAADILNRRGIQELYIDDAPVVGRPDMLPERQMMAGDVYPTTAPVGDRRFGHRRAIGVFSNHRDAEAALIDLRDSGFSMNQVSLIAKDQNHGSNIAGAAMSAPERTKADEGAKTGAATGGALGGLGGLLVGLGALAVPGVGPVLLGGAAATALATALTGGAIGAAAGGLAGGLVGLGIPEDRARVYDDRFQRGDYLVMVDGTDEELRRAEAILSRRGIRDWDIFDATDSNVPRTSTVDSVRTTGMSPMSDRRPDVTLVDRREETL